MLLTGSFCSCRFELKILKDLVTTVDNFNCKFLKLDNTDLGSITRYTQTPSLSVVFLL